jgi:hypothetical protein
MEQYVNIMLDRGFKAVFGNKQVVIDCCIVERRNR